MQSLFKTKLKSGNFKRSHKFLSQRPKQSNENIVWSEIGFLKSDRERHNGHKAMVIWLTGLSASGKSTIARGLHRVLFQEGRQVYVLDGDNVRRGLNSDLGFSKEDRKENIRRIGEVAKLFVDAGFIVITAFISPFREDRDRVRALLKKEEFVEIYVKADISICEQRDPKGLYKKARLGLIKEFTGISSPYEPPKDPDLIFNTEILNASECVQLILDFFKSRQTFEIPR